MKREWRTERWGSCGSRRLPGTSPQMLATAFVCAFFLPLFSIGQSARRSRARTHSATEARSPHPVEHHRRGPRQVRGPHPRGQRALLNLLGYSREELGRALHLERITPPEHAEASRRAIAKLRESGVSPIYEKEYIRKDGARVPVIVGMASLDRYGRHHRLRVGHLRAKGGGAAAGAASPKPGGNALA